MDRNQDGETSVAAITAFTSIDDVVAGLGRIEKTFAQTADRRGVFVEAYLLITAEIRRRIDAGAFEDNAWVARYVVAFAELYRKALVGYEVHDADVPTAWTIAFDAARSGSTLIIQDLLLGINAHINNDLPNALLAVTIDPDRASRKRDHDAINAALADSVDAVEQRIATLYAPELAKLGSAFGRLDEELANFSFAKARAAAWVAGTNLVNARSDERADVQRHIDDHAAVLGRLILAPSARHPLLAEALQRIEESAPNGSLARSLAISASLLHSPLVVGDLTELADRLAQLVQRFDSATSRMSVYPTIYLEVTRRFQAALATPGFFVKPDWVLELDRHFSTLYFDALSSFERGRDQDLPACWLKTFRAATDSSTSVFQDLLLALNVRLWHDLGIALYRAGVTREDSAARTADFLKIHELFKASIDTVQAAVAKKYSRLLGFLDLLGGPIDELVIDHEYIAGRDRALAVAKDLTALPSDAARFEYLATLDEEVTSRADTILLRHIPGGTWLGRVLRRSEDALPGTWSALVG